MRFFTTLFGIALASAAAVPTTEDKKAGHLIYGDVQIDLTPGCQNVPQNNDDNGPKPTNIFTELGVYAGFICKLHHAPKCDEDGFISVKGPGQKAEYVSSWLFSAKCTEIPRDLSALPPRANNFFDCGAITSNDVEVPLLSGGACLPLTQEIPASSTVTLKALSGKKPQCNCHFYTEETCPIEETITFERGVPKHNAVQLRGYRCLRP